MAIEDLDTFLFQVTPSEEKHQTEGPDVLSSKYSLIRKVKYHKKEVYQFRYKSILGPTNIAINKESRWTFIPPHVHTVIEMLYVYHGKCTQNIKNTKITMNQGDFCIVDQNVLHSIDYLSKDDIVLSIEIKKEYLTNGILTKLGNHGILASFLANAISLSSKHDSFLLFRNLNKSAQENINKMVAEYYDKTLCSDQIINAHMILLMCELMRQFRYKQDFLKSTNTIDIARILSYIEKNYKNITLKKLASIFGFHPNYLSHLIKANTGKTFKSLIQQQRFENVAYLLTNTQIPIYKIAQQAGYDNLGFFYKKFNSLYHLSPKQYRKQNS